MPVQINNGHPGPIVEVKVSGKLTAEDYNRFAPEMEELIDSHGKVRLLFVMEDFDGWDAGAMWEETKFDFKHAKNLERVAMAGTEKWHEWVTRLCRVFNAVECRYFDISQVHEARAWLREP